MMADLMALTDISQAALWSGFLIFLRVGAMMAVLPAFGEQTVPVRVRLGLAFAFCLIVAPGVDTGAAPARSLSPDTILFCAPEVITGLFFGLLLRFMVFTLQIAGTIAAQSTSLSQIFGGTAGADPQPAMSHVLVVAGIALATIMGLHVSLAAYILRSYVNVPLGTFIATEVMADIGVRATARTFSLAFTLAAPFLAASLLYNVTLGIINRAMPQLMVSFVGAPAITAGGLLLLALTAPLMLAVWADALSTVLAQPGDPR